MDAGWAEIAIRFGVGGLIVSLFAMVGEVLRPKTLAGIFTAAPSVALATLTLAFASQGTAAVVAECRTMTLGAVGFIAYGAACVVVVRRATIPVWLGAGLCWSAWLVTALGLYWAMAMFR